MKFPDGSFWSFGSRSQELDDFGTSYPTLFQDSNGNQVKVVYDLNNYSGTSRISRIEDVRAVNSGGNWGTYDFTYDYTSTPPHLTSITNRIGTSEGYTFNYSTQNLTEPFSGAAWPTGANKKFLTGLTISGVGLSYAMAYQGSWTGELAKVTLPQGGYVRWTLANWNYTASRTLRDVSAWIQSKDGTVGAEKSYSITHEANDGTKTLHTNAQVLEPGSTALKTWTFNASGLVTSYYSHLLSPVFAWQLDVTSVWTTDANGKPYISVTTTTLDPGQAYAASKRTEQTVDAYGNLTQMKLFDWGNTTTPRRTFTNTYLNGSSYANAYIRNRLTQQTLLEGGVTYTLVQSTFDNYWPSCPIPGGCALVAVSAPNQHDTANYPVTNTIRGNLTNSVLYGNVNTIWNRFDQTGNVLASIDQTGVIRSSAWASNFAAPSQITVGSFTDTISWTGFLGLQSTTGGNGTSSTVYDSYARPSSTTAPTNTVTTYSYTNTTTTATTNGRWVRITTDGFGRILKTETGYGATTVSTVENQYEPCACTPIGKLKQTSRPYAPGGTKYWTVYTYDSLGRTLTVRAPDGASTSSYTYQGTTVIATDAAGKWKKYRQDALGNLEKVWEPNPAGGADFETTYTYNAFNKLLTVSMPRSGVTQTRTFTYWGTGYNGAGKLKTKTEPETGTTTYSYDNNGMLVYKDDAKGQTVKFEYDLTYRRLKTITKYPNGIFNPADPCQTVDLYWDTNPFSSFSAGQNRRLAAVQYRGWGCGAANGNTYVEEYAYTNYGAITGKQLRVTKKILNSSSVLVDAVAQMAAYWSYDSEGRPLTVQYPLSGTTMQYTWDSRGMPSKLRNTTLGVDVVSSAVYGAAGEITQMVTGGGTENRGFNVNGQLTSVSAPGVSQTYTYSATQNNGQITSMVDSGETITYQYDSLKRLISTAGTGWSQSFAFDGFGNLATKTGVNAPSWNGGSDQATNRVPGFSYDLNGNQTFHNGFTLSYDILNRMQKAESSSQKSEYDYASDNKRIGERRWTGSAGSWVAAAEWVYFFGVDGQRLGKYTLTATGGATPSLSLSSAGTSVWFRGKLVQKTSAAGTVSWANEDRLGSVGKYLPFGEDKPGASNPTADNEKFATYTRDGVTGLDYADQRWHSPGVGRFLSSDPYQASGGPGEPGSWNRYGYVNGDPINSVDPNGLLSVPVGPFMAWLNMPYQEYVNSTFYELGYYYAGATNPGPPAPWVGHQNMLESGACIHAASGLTCDEYDRIKHECGTLPPIPKAPPGVDPNGLVAGAIGQVDFYVQGMAFDARLAFPEDPGAQASFVFGALVNFFQTQFSHGAQWDIKNWPNAGPEYQDLGNWFYGAVGQSAFNNSVFVQMAGGFYAIWTDIRRTLAGQSPDGSMLPFPPTYGESLQDHTNIVAGIQFVKTGCAKNGILGR